MPAFLLKTTHGLGGLYLDLALLPGLQTVLILELADVAGCHLQLLCQIDDVHDHS